MRLLLAENGSTFTGQVLNNLIYPTGDAVDVNGSSSGVLLRNNILWVQAGADINVAADSQQGFNSDYNDLYAPGAGALGVWQGLTENWSRGQRQPRLRQYVWNPGRRLERPGNGH